MERPQSRKSALEPTTYAKTKTLRNHNASVPLRTHRHSHFLILLSDCSRHNISQYQDNQPAFQPEHFFQGSLSAEGVLKNHQGIVTRYFSATIDATWDKGAGTLAERFEFNDGEIQYRTWTLTPTGKNNFNAIAGDVIGTGTGEVAGNALHLNYVLEIDYNNKPLQLTVDDWMWQVSENTVINQSTLSKWGFTVGSIQLVIQKLPIKPSD